GEPGPARTDAVTARWRTPDPVGEIFGRGQEIADLSGRLTAPMPTRVIGIGGLPGVGKTRLAIEVARRVRPDFPDGQWFLRFEPDRPGDPATVLFEALLAAGVPAGRIPPESRARGDMLSDSVTGRRVLLVVVSVAELCDR